MQERLKLLCKDRFRSFEQKLLNFEAPKKWIKVHPLNLKDFTLRTRSKIRYTHFFMAGPEEWKKTLGRDGFQLDNLFDARRYIRDFNIGRFKALVNNLTACILYKRDQMKNKSENEKILELRESEERSADIVSADQETVRKYLIEVSCKDQIKEPELQKLYDYIRNTLSESLGHKDSSNPIYAALIERIARTALILDKMERLLFQSEAMNKDEVLSAKYKGSTYPLLLTEHRKCIETLSMLIQSSKTQKKGKIIEKLSSLVFEES